MDMIDEVLGRRQSTGTSKHNSISKHNDHTESNSDGDDDEIDNSDLALRSTSPHKNLTNNSTHSNNNKYIKSPTGNTATAHTVTTPAIRVKHKPKGTNPLASKVSSKVSLYSMDILPSTCVYIYCYHPLSPSSSFILFYIYTNAHIPV